jgi:hypothetical protein
MAFIPYAGCLLAWAESLADMRDETMGKVTGSSQEWW